jgi:hypothetical protein
VYDSILEHGSKARVSAEDRLEMRMCRREQCVL